MTERGDHPDGPTRPGAPGIPASTQRLEAFSDGVFAIAITLLVIDLRMPAEAGIRTAQAFWHALWGMWPHLLSFGLSFAIVGVVWANHRTMFSFIRRADHGLVILNLLLLFDVALLPFAAALLSDLIDEPAARQGAVLVYCGVLVVGGLVYNLLWFHAARTPGLLVDDLDPALVRRLGRRYASGPLLYGAALVATLIDSRLGLGACAFLVVLFLWPGFTHPG